MGSLERNKNPRNRRSCAGRQRGSGEGVVEVGASEERMERMRHASRNANATRFGLSGFILWQSIIVLQLQSA